MNRLDKEIITFEIYLRPEYQVNPPHAEILLNNDIKFSSYIETELKISFKETIYFGSHCLSLIRSNTEKNQLLFIDKIVIDGVNIRDIVWTKSYNIPIYPEPWATIYRRAGNTLEEKVIGETCLGHNSTWVLNFYSPTYEFVMDWMRYRD